MGMTIAASQLYIDSRCCTHIPATVEMQLSLFAIHALTYVFAALANGAQLIQRSRSFAIALMVVAASNVLNNLR
jgi:hypothetical protein